MKEFKGTPGPWSVRHNSEDLSYARDDLVADGTICLSISGAEPEEFCLALIISDCVPGEANARAIAACPMMIAALQEAEDHIVTMYAGICGGDAEAARRFADKDPTVAKVRAALSRALTPEEK